MVPEDLLCSICHLNEHKYKCPACGVKTCSINCVKRHKRQTECTGLVDQSKFIPKKTLADDESHINRDYNFLLNVGRQIHVGKGDIKTSAKNIFKRTPGGGNQNRNKRPKFNSNEEQKPEDTRIECVKKAFLQDPLTVIKRNNTMIVQLPQGMHRATSNKTGYDKKAGSFIWTIEWVVIDESGKERARFVSYRLKEHLLLRDAIPMNILNNTAGLDLKTNDSTNEIVKERLHFYLENVVNLNKSKNSILDLNGSVLISEALTNKIVLEYPTIYITFNSDTWKEYIVSEEEAYNYAKHETLSEDSSNSETSDSDTSDSSGDDSDDSDDSSDDDLENDSESDEAPQESSSKPHKIAFTNEIDQPISEAVADGLSETTATLSNNSTSQQHQ